MVCRVELPRAGFEPFRAVGFPPMCRRFLTFDSHKVSKHGARWVAAQNRREHMAERSDALGAPSFSPYRFRSPHQSLLLLLPFAFHQLVGEGTEILHDQVLA
jgi:hypothetical protein